MPNVSYVRRPLEEHTEDESVTFTSNEDVAVITIMQPEHNISTDKALLVSIELDEDELDEWIEKLSDLYNETF